MRTYITLPNHNLRRQYWSWYCRPQCQSHLHFYNFGTYTYLYTLNYSLSIYITLMHNFDLIRPIGAGKLSVIIGSSKLLFNSHSYPSGDGKFWIERWARFKTIKTKRLQNTLHFNALIVGGNCAASDWN